MPYAANSCMIGATEIKTAVSITRQGRGSVRMKNTEKAALIIFALAFAVVPLISQTAATQKPSFEVVSIKPSAPGLGIRGGGPRGDRYSMVGAKLRTLLQNGFSRATNTRLGGQLHATNAQNSSASHRYD